MAFASKDLLQGVKRKSNSRFHIVISGIVLLLLLWALWTELNARENLDQLWPAFLQQLQQANSLWLAGVLGLMPLNWLTEALKWQRFMQKYEPMPLRRALLAVWIGVSFSLFTPNRVGEYGGRILLVRPENRWKAVIINLVGNYSQYLILLTAGALGACYFFSRYGFPDYPWLEYLGWIISGGLLLLHLLYFNLKRAMPFLLRIPGLRRWRFLQNELAVLHHFSPAELLQLYSWSALRYGIYTTQYFLLLHFFGISPGIFTAFAGIATIFLVQTSLPLPPLTGLVARGNLAIWIWLHFGANEVSSLAATFALWIINLILPALIGTFSLLYVNITKLPGYEDD